VTPVEHAHEIVACALRPEGSLAHLASLIAFVLFARRLAPAAPRRKVR
jgi:hypothetical protein